MACIISGLGSGSGPGGGGIGPGGVGPGGVGPGGTGPGGVGPGGVGPGVTGWPRTGRLFTFPGLYILGTDLYLGLCCSHPNPPTPDMVLAAIFCMSVMGADN